MTANSIVTSLPFAQRHKPQSFADLIFADQNIEDRLRLYAERKMYRDILLFGPYGTAKSTTAEIVVRERHKFCNVSNGCVERYGPTELKKNLKRLINSISMLLVVNGNDNEPFVIIDEVDQLPIHDQHDLRVMLDTLPVGKVIMTTNNLAKVDGGLINRCDTLSLSGPTPQRMLPRAQAILAAEGVFVNPSMLISLLQLTPDMRHMLRELENFVIFQQAPNTPSPPSPPASPSPRPKLTVLTPDSVPDTP